MKKYFRNLKKFSLIIYPEGTKSEIRSYQLNGNKILIYGFIYTISVILIGFYTIYFTPLNNVFLPSWIRQTTIEEEQYQELSSRIVMLATELNNLKSANARLKKALQLGDTTLFKDTDQNSDKIDSIKKKLPIEGNLLYSVTVLMDRIFLNNSDEEAFFILPIKGYVSREFKLDKGHIGIDFVAKENTPVNAAAAGYVIFSNYTPNYGYALLISHGSGYLTKYYHCNVLMKKEGDIVKQGELIALSGNTGTNTTGPHLHFEIWKNGKPIDPKKVLINY